MTRTRSMRAFQAPETTSGVLTASSRPSGDTAASARTAPASTPRDPSPPAAVAGSVSKAELPVPGTRPGEPTGSRPPDPPAAIDLKGVSKAYGRNVALANVDLVVPQGSSVLISGSNGAGKTTLLRIIATVISPTFGGGLILGHDLTHDRAKVRAGTELLGHRTRLYEDLTPFEYLEFVKRLWGCRSASVPEALARVHLWRHRDERIRGLSQGMRQKVALARVYLRRPELLLLDEPYGPLDARARLLVDDLLLEMKQNSRTVLIATHDVDRVAPGVDLRIHLEGGRNTAQAELGFVK